MKAECGENYLKINLSNGVVFHTTPTLLSSDFEHRIIPFTMIKEQRGNWEDVKLWFEKTLGWKISFTNKEPIDIEKERALIGKFKQVGFKPLNEFNYKKDRIKQEVLDAE